MRQPDLVAYQAAVQHPSTAFADQQLRTAQVTNGPLGLPRAVAGNFAVTYQLRAGTRQWAVRCFHREAADRASRYAAISQTLAKLHGGPLVPIEYLDPGVRVGTAWYPITKMPWIEGYPLNRSVEAALSRPATLRNLERRFVELVTTLRAGGIAHGDLQHGNILVESAGSLRLVDYDGMFVPALHGRAASECGDPNYQHPRRGLQFDAELDRFAALVIVVALRALASAPRLWQTYNTGDNLLFRRADFANPSQSALFGELAGIAEVRDLARALAQAARDDYARVPLVQDLLAPPRLVATTPTPIKPAHAAVLNQLYGPRRARNAGGRSWKLRRAASVDTLALSGESVLASGERQGRVTLRLAATGRTQRSLRLPAGAGELHALAFSERGRLLALTRLGPRLVVWDASEGRPVADVLCSERQLRAAALSTNGRWLVAATVDGVVRCWRLSDARLVAQFGVRGQAGALAVSADGSTLAVAGARGAVHLYALPSGAPVGSITVGRSATCLAFTGAGSKLAIGTAVGRVSLWEVGTCQLAGELAVLEAPLQALVLTADARVLAAAGRDGSLWLRRLSATVVPPRVRPRQKAALRMMDSGQRFFDWLRRVALL